MWNKTTNAWEAPASPPPPLKDATQLRGRSAYYVSGKSNNLFKDAARTQPVKATPGTNAGGGRFWTLDNGDIVNSKGDVLEAVQVGAKTLYKGREGRFYRADGTPAGVTWNATETRYEGTKGDVSTDGVNWTTRTATAAAPTPFSRELKAGKGTQTETYTDKDAYEYAASGIIGRNYKRAVLKRNLRGMSKVGIAEEIKNLTALDAQVANEILKAKSDLAKLQANAPADVTRLAAEIKKLDDDRKGLEQEKLVAATNLKDAKDALADIDLDENTRFPGEIDLIVNGYLASPNTILSHITEKGPVLTAAAAANSTTARRVTEGQVAAYIKSNPGVQEVVDLRNALIADERGEHAGFATLSARKGAAIADVAKYTWDTAKDGDITRLGDELTDATKRRSAAEKPWLDDQQKLTDLESDLTTKKGKIGNATAKAQGREATVDGRIADRDALLANLQTVNAKGIADGTVARADDAGFKGPISRNLDKGRAPVDFEGIEDSSRLELSTAFSKKGGNDSNRATDIDLRRDKSITNMVRPLGATTDIDASFEMGELKVKGIPAKSGTIPLLPTPGASNSSPSTSTLLTRAQITEAEAGNAGGQRAVTAKRAELNSLSDTEFEAKFGKFRS